MKHAESSAATKAVLVKSFCQLYEQLPLEKVTVKEISEKAGVSRVTFYNYFSDPYQLVEELEDEIIETFIANARLTITSSLNSDLFTTIFIDTFEKNKPLVKLLFTGSHAGVFVAKAKESIIALISPLIKDYGANSFESYAIEYHISGMVGIFQRWFIVEDVETSQMAPIIKNILLNSPVASIIQA